MPRVELSYPDIVHDEYDEPDCEAERYCECSTAGYEDYGPDRVYRVHDGSGLLEVDADTYRLVGQYEAARRRRFAAEEACMDARGWEHAEEPLAEEPLAEEDEPAPESVPPAGKLTARQALFCDNYAAQPVAARAAVLAGYTEENAANQGHRLLKNPLILTRIAALRAERKLSYVLEADTVHDKLEAVFFDALSGGHHAAAVAALRLQAGLARLPTRATTAGAEGDAKPAKIKRTRGRRQAEKSRGKRRKKTRKADGSR